MKRITKNYIWILLFGSLALEASAQVINTNQDLHFRNIEYHSDTQNHTAYDDYIKVNLKTSNGNDNIIVDDDIGGKRDKSHGGRRSIMTSNGNDTLIVGDDVQYGAMIDMGNGDDRIQIAGNLEDDVSILMGNGNDSVDIHRMKSSSLLTGIGNDTVNIQRIDKGLAVIHLGMGNDILYLENVSSRYDNGSVKLGLGNDSLTIEDTLSGTKSIFDGGMGIDSLVLTSVSKKKWQGGIKDIFVNFEKVTFRDGSSISLMPTSIDIIPPVITLNGEENIILFEGESYKELGASAIDEKDGEVDVTISASVDTTIVGNYTVTYTATDKAGNEARITRIVTVVAPILKSISLESNVSTLNVGESAELSVMGTYSDANTKRVDADIEYIITPSENAELNGAVLIAKKDGEVSVQVKVGAILSNTLNVNIAWVVDGHVLPPEPDSTINNATLGGVDSNDNGVRDDVERNIYKKYSKKLHHKLLMENAKIYQRTLIEPTSNAINIQKEVSRIIDCELYLGDFDKNIDADSWIEVPKDVKNLTFNNIERVEKYLAYNLALSGGSYGSSQDDVKREACNPKVIRALEEAGL